MTSAERWGSPSPTRPPAEDTPLNALHTSAAQYLKDTAAVIASSTDVATRAVDLFESLYDSNPQAAYQSEIATYRAISTQWQAIEQSAPPGSNLRSVAASNATFTTLFTNDVIAAHNGQFDFEEADNEWRVYQDYAGWAQRQSAVTIVDMEKWDLVLGRPT